MEAILWLLVFAIIITFTVRWLLAWSMTPLSRQFIQHLLLQRLVAHGCQPIFLADGGNHLTIRVGERTCSIQLEQLYRRCTEVPSASSDLINQVADSIQAALEEDDALPLDWERHILPVLVSTDAVFPPHLLVRPFADGLVVAFAIDEPAAFRWLTSNDLAVMELTIDTVYTQALINLERSCNMLVIDAHDVRPDGQDRLLRFVTNDGLDATRLLLPSFYQRFSPRFDDADLIVAIPARDSLLLTSIDYPEQHTFLRWRSNLERTHRAYPLRNMLYQVNEHGIKPYHSV